MERRLLVGFDALVVEGVVAQGGDGSAAGGSREHHWAGAQ